MWQLFVYFERICSGKLILRIENSGELSGILQKEMIYLHLGLAATAEAKDRYKGRRQAFSRFSKRRKLKGVKPYSLELLPEEMIWREGEAGLKLQLSFAKPGHLGILAMILINIQGMDSKGSGPPILNYPCKGGCNAIGHIDYCCLPGAAAVCLLGYPKTDVPVDSMPK
ncbi:hypothetical protein DUI87_08358 [Hirundo rustica rustica]|uniref:Uncharacterized protein n=1 Tax=Hirundo rustica rustica TaxID=333673 RepID=A0A3M0KXG9_HIRRU|nr:hypothetical protein DUI87_08358 [Hirundo rustica rustica]